MKKVSIIVPLYKSELFLHKLVDSVLNQTYKNVELILVDDESPDNSGLIADHYAAKDERVKVIHQKNMGCCGARNTGLKNISGEYLMFADGDDWMELDCVEYLVKIMENNNCQMAMTDSVFTSFDTKANVMDCVRVCSSEEACASILYADIPIGPWNKIYTTSIIKEKGLCFDVPWFGEGLYFSVMASQYSNSVAVGHKRIYHYCLDNPNSGTTLKNVEHAKNAYRNIHFIKDSLVVRTPKTLAAATWHIVNNDLMVLNYIYNSANPEMYKDWINKCIVEYRSLFWSVVRDSHESYKKKIFYIIVSLSPVGYMKYRRFRHFIKLYLYNLGRNK